MYIKIKKELAVYKEFKKILKINRNPLLLILTIVFLCVSCSDNDDGLNPINQEPDETLVVSPVGIIDFNSSVDEFSTIFDLDIEDGQLYFIHKTSIYKINLNSNPYNVDLVIHDEIDFPTTLRVINNKLFYQGDPFWSESPDIKQIDTDNFTNGIELTYPVVGVSRSQLFKYMDGLYYVSSSNGFSPTNNFYEFNPLLPDELISSDEFIIPRNMRVADNFLYYSSFNEIRRLDLDNPNQGSTIVYIVPDIENSTNNNDGDIYGFDIDNNIIYFTRISMNKLFAKDLTNPEDEPIVIKTYGDDGATSYGKLILGDGMLYVKRVEDNQFEVFEIE